MKRCKICETSFNFCPQCSILPDEDCQYRGFCSDACEKIRDEFAAYDCQHKPAIEVKAAIEALGVPQFNGRYIPKWERICNEASQQHVEPKEVEVVEVVEMPEETEIVIEDEVIEEAEIEEEIE